MNFKEVQLVGFKSFADKTSIKFDDGVTCIVGPNGCGKSNVADAVRWVLGEQSAKNLRGSSMQDVIFGGTETRRQLSYCEVTLVFDNSTKLFDVEYDEVALTRRLYRSGDSEYLLNMQPCRLKDIVALLHGVGIGKEGYSIIGQGKVAQIMNSKPVDRRTIFEEATGVMKFKTEKVEIERKLENAKDNLTVFVQRMDEAENQLRPLEKQAETAKKYREFSDRLKYEEVNTYLVRCDTFSAETEKQQKKIDEANEGLARVEARIAEVETEEQQARAAIARADGALRDLNEKLRLFEVGMEHKSGEAKVIGERIQSYRRQLSVASDDVEYSLRRTKEIDKEVAAGRKKAAEQGKRSRDIEREVAKLIAELAEADGRVAAFDKEFDEKRASEISTVEDLADIRVNAGSLAAKRDAAQDRIGEVRLAVEKAQVRGDRYREQLKACLGEIAAGKAFLDGKEEKEEKLNAEVAELSRARQKISEEIVGCETSIANLTNNLEFYTALKNKFNGYRESVRQLQMNAQRDPELGRRIKGSIADIVTTEQRYEVAIETAFGGAMQNLVTATQDDAQYLIQYLKRTGGGIVTFLPVDAMRPHGDSREVNLALREKGALGLAADLVKYDFYYDNVIRNFLGNTLICDTIEPAKDISRKYPRAFRIIALDGDNIAVSGAMTGGSHRKDSGALLAGERHIKECEEGIAKKRAAAEKFRAALVRSEKELEEAQAECEAFRAKAQEEAARYAAAVQRKAALEGLVEEADRDLSEYNAALEKLSRAVNDLESEALASAETEDVLNRIRSEASAATTAQAQEIEKMRAERDALAEKLNALKVEEASIATALTAEEGNTARLEAEKEELLLKVERTRESIRATEGKIAELRKDEEKVSLTEDEQSAVSALRGQLGAVEEEKKEINEKQGLLDDEKRNLLTLQYKLGEQKHAGELEISRVETNLENMKQRIDEAYGLSYESAQELRDESYDFSQSSANITSLRHKISALGNVNMNAEEDYANLLARYTDMQTQRQDLEKGIDDLSGVLASLKEEMQKKFDEGFNEINQNFTQIFKELFGGGRAEMQLDYTDCDDPLEAGVEIVACPPGKKLAKLSLLSGGEQAFTAIAILFAILKSRPMPFCILDEIEAALDEANVDRFAKYLKKFSQDTQFIVITHRKPTMNQADSLFGVTMEEKGVSKIVSVKLSEVESRLGGDTVM